MILLCILLFYTVIGDDASCHPDLLNRSPVSDRHTRRNANTSVAILYVEARKLKNLTESTRSTDSYVRKADEPRGHDDEHDVGQYSARTRTPITEHAAEYISTHILDDLLYWSRTFFSLVVRLISRTEGTQSTSGTRNSHIAKEVASSSGGRAGLHQGVNVHDRARFLAEDGLPPNYRYVCAVMCVSLRKLLL